MMICSRSFLTQPWWCVDMLYDGCIYLLLLLSSFLVWSWGVCIEIPDLTTFRVSISCIVDFPSSRFERTEVYDCSWWCHCVTCFDLTIFGVFDQVLWYILSYFLVARWRTRGYCDLSLMPSVADRELLWSLWFLFDAFQLLVENWCDYCGLYLWCFPVACIGLRWSCDFMISDFVSLG